MAVGVDRGLARAAGARLHIQGVTREAAALQYEMSEYLQQGVARLAKASLCRNWKFFIPP